MRRSVPMKRQPSSATHEAKFADKLGCHRTYVGGLEQGSGTSLQGGSRVRILSFAQVKAQALHKKRRRFTGLDPIVRSHRTSAAHRTTIEPSTRQFGLPA
jgi:hypothetical protein